MYPSIRRRFGIRELLALAMMVLLVLTLKADLFAQQNPAANILQTPQVFRFAPPGAPNVASLSQTDPAPLIRIPVAVSDDAGKCVSSLNARDFSLSIDGEESPIEWFRPNRATAAALGVLVDISQGMEFKSFSGRTFSKLPFIQSAIKTVVDKLDGQDNVFLATFARRFHMLDDFTSDHRDLEQRLPMLKVTDQLDDFDANGIYESLMKGITVLAHAPKICERRALLVFTNAYCDTSTHGADDVIAKAQFAGVTVYNVIVPGFFHRSEVFSVSNEMKRIAAETGGLTFVASDNSEDDFIASTTDAIASDLNNQYELGFPVSRWSPNALPVELMLLHHQGMRVRAPRVVRFRSDELFPESSPAQNILPE